MLQAFFSSLRLHFFPQAYLEKCGLMFLSTSNRKRNRRQILSATATLGAKRTKLTTLSGCKGEHTLSSMSIKTTQPILGVCELMYAQEGR